MKCIDNAGLYRFGIQYDGSLWWGQVALADVDDTIYEWPPFDTTLNRVGVAALGTDGDFYAGVPTGAPRDNRLVVRAASGSTSHFELWTDGAASLQLFATTSHEGHMQVGANTVLRYYNNPVGVSGASVAIGGVDDATATLVVDNTTNNNTVKCLVLRKHATQSGNSIELQTSTGGLEWKVDNNSRWTIIGQENATSGILRIQARGDTGNDDAGITLYAPATPNSSASRNWHITTNFNQAGNLDIMRSTSSTGSPLTVVASFDSSGRLGIGMVPTAFKLDMTVSPASGSYDGFELISGAGCNSYFLTTNSASLWSLSGTWTGLGIGTGTAHPVLIATNSTERIRITSGGQVGIGTASPTSGTTLDVNGTARALGYVSAIASKTSAYTITTSDSTITADATSAAFAVTLPAASGVPAGRQYTVKKIDSSANVVTLTAAGSDLIDGASTYNLTTQYQTASVVSDGTSKWWLL